MGARSRQGRGGGRERGRERERVRERGRERGRGGEKERCTCIYSERYSFRYLITAHLLLSMP